MNTRNVLKDSDVIAMCGVAMVDVRRDRVAGPRTSVAGEAGTRRPAAETAMPGHDRSVTADKPTKFARRQQLRLLKQTLMTTTITAT